MLRTEAQWIGQTLMQLPDDAFPLLNLGSSTGDVRAVEQPWVDEYIFAPMRRANRQVIHVDHKPDEGVDIVADITRPDDIARVRERRYNSVLCSNLFEHLEHPDEGVAALTSLTAPGHRVIVTGPWRFPPHPDPIDNGLRLDAAQLAAFLGQAFEVAEAATFNDRLLLSLYGEQSRFGRASVIAALFTPWLRESTQWRILATWSFRRAKAAGLLLTRR